MIAWGVFDKDGYLVRWTCRTDNEEGLEIHRTRRLARAACFEDEHVEKLMITRMPLAGVEVQKEQ